MNGKPIDEWSMREILGDDLLKDEKILWAGQPDPSIMFSRADVFLIPFSLLWGGFALFWEAAALGLVFRDSKGGPADLFFALFGLPFVAIGLYMIFGRFIYKRWRKKHTYYAVTDRRVLVLITSWRRSLQAVRISTIPTMNKTVGADKVGTIVFGNMTYASHFGNTGLEFTGSGYGGESPAFYDIRNADFVYGLVNGLMDKAGGAGSGG